MSRSKTVALIPRFRRPWASVNLSRTGLAPDCSRGLRYYIPDQTTADNKDIMINGSCCRNYCKIILIFAIAIGYLVDFVTKCLLDIRFADCWSGCAKDDVLHSCETLC